METDMPRHPEEETKQHERLLKSFERFRKQELEEFHTYLSRPWRIVWLNFLAGTVRGLGFLLGAAIIITLAGFILKDLLSNVPVIGKFAQAMDAWIEETISNRP